MRRPLALAAAILSLVVGMSIMLAGHTGDQQLDCPAGMTVTPNGAGTRGACVATPPPVTRPTFVTAPRAVPSTIAAGQSAQLQWDLTGGAPTQQTIEPGIGTVPATTRTRTVAPTVTTTYTILAANSAGASTAPVTVTVTVTPPTIQGGPIAASSLGNCTEAAHDRHVVGPFAGLLYRTWHTQIDAAAGCTYAHEHGDDPRRLAAAAGALPMPAFGYIVQRTPGHPVEPHEGYKCFVSNRGDVNNEGRVSLVYSRSCFHMGTLGPARFEQPHHSAEILVVAPDRNLRAYTQLMMNTGGFGGVCDPRKAPQKDGLVLGTCKVNSLYEIWTTEAGVFANINGVIVEVYHAFATPAVFDPLTAFDPANPTRVIPIWDPVVNALLNFPNNDRSGSRGCERESYAQPGYWRNGNGAAVYFTSSMGQPLAQTDPNALRQEITVADAVDVLATNDGLNQFKMRVDYCAGRDYLPGDKMGPRSFIFGTLNKAALLFRN